MLDHAAYGGTVNGEMAQGVEESYAAIKFDAKTAGGACFALSVMWTMHQTKLTHNFSDYLAWIKRPSGIRMMNNRQVKMVEDHGQGVSVDDSLRNWLVSLGFAYGSIDQIATPATAAGLNALVDPLGFKHIYLDFSGGRHAITANATAGGATFFDPNFGEVAFGSHDNFKRWMAERLLPCYPGLTYCDATSYTKGVGQVVT